MRRTPGEYSQAMEAVDARAIRLAKGPALCTSAGELRVRAGVTRAETPRGAMGHAQVFRFGPEHDAANTARRRRVGWGGMEQGKALTTSLRPSHSAAAVGRAGRMRVGPALRRRRAVDPGRWDLRRPRTALRQRWKKLRGHGDRQVPIWLCRAHGSELQRRARAGRTGGFRAATSASEVAMWVGFVARRCHSHGVGTIDSMRNLDTCLLLMTE